MISPQEFDETVEHSLEVMDKVSYDEKIALWDAVAKQSSALKRWFRETSECDNLRVGADAIVGEADIELYEACKKVIELVGASAKADPDVSLSASVTPPVADRVSAPGATQAEDDVPSALSAPRGIKVGDRVRIREGVSVTDHIGEVGTVTKAYGKSGSVYVTFEDGHSEPFAGTEYKLVEPFSKEGPYKPGQKVRILRGAYAGEVHRVREVRFDAHVLDFPGTEYADTGLGFYTDELELVPSFTVTVNGKLVQTS